MTQIIEKYKHQLRFCIDSDAPPKYVTKFKTLKNKIENENSINFQVLLYFQIKEKCKLESNKNLPLLERMEGGLGGNNNITNKQLRYRSFLQTCNYNDNDIIINIENSEIEKWTYEELDDIILSFIKVCNNYMNTDCINGCIELIDRNSFSDDYLYSDDEL